MNKRSLHIMHVLGNFGNGGAEMGVVRLIRHYPDPEVRHSVCAIGRDVSLSGALPANATCFSLGIDGRNPFGFQKVARLIKSERIQVVHVNNLAPWFDAALAARLTGIPCIETFHGVESHGLRLSRLKGGMIRVAARMSHAVTAVSPAAGGLLASLSGLVPDAIRIIPNGIDVEEFRPPESAAEKEAIRRAFGLPATGLLFGCVGALRSVKNHAGLVQAFAKLCHNPLASCDQGPWLALVGTGPLAASLKQQADELGCEERIHFLGQRSEEDVKQLLRAFDVFVLNSHTEGLSYALLEALASGLPCVVTAVGSNPELVRDGVEGFLVPADDVDGLAAGLVRITEQKGDLAKLAGAARRKALDYSFARMVDAYAQLYRDAVRQ